MRPLITARESAPRPQEQRVALRRNYLHPLNATERSGALHPPAAFAPRAVNFNFRKRTLQNCKRAERTIAADVPRAKVHYLCELEAATCQATSMAALYRNEHANQLDRSTSDRDEFFLCLSVCCCCVLHAG